MPLGLRPLGIELLLRSKAYTYKTEYDISPLRFWETAAPEYWQRDAQGSLALNLAIAYEHPETVLALLKTLPPPPNEAMRMFELANALRECLGEGDHMNECIEELVINLGADVSVCLDGHPTAIDMAVITYRSLDVIEMLVLQGHNMDFDHFQPFLCESSSKVTELIKAINICSNPLEKLVYGFMPVLSLLSSNQRGWNESACVLFVQMGATRRGLDWVLLREMRRSEDTARPRLLNTLMDSFAYLPELSKLDERLISRVHPFDRAADVLEHPSWARDIAFILQVDTFHTPRGGDTASYEERWRSYVRRQAQVPSMLHLSRCAIRLHMGANVRDFITKTNLSKALKEYILLGYRIN